jgi:predicted phosphodiesterase
VKYAIFSDIHGNLPALKAALSDADARKADTYIFLGDYTSGFPWGNEAAETIRGIKSATVIRGNGEGYLIDLLNKPLEEMTCEQFKPIYWAYRSLTKENLDYLAALPENISVFDGTTEIRLNHSFEIFYRTNPINLFSSNKLRTLMTAPFSRQEYLELTRNAVLSRLDVLADIASLPRGIYLFGHNHLQFHMELDGRLFINPGSCGEALDWDTTAAYTLLECEGDHWRVDERRVKYDLDDVVKGFRESGYEDYAPMWSRIMELELKTAKDYFMPFVLHLIDAGRKLGRTEYPVSNDVFYAAVKTWDASRI